MPTRRPKVHVSVSFSLVKNVSKPLLMIENPVDLTEEIGAFELTDYEGLKDAIHDIVKEPCYGLFFHHDSSHTYSFDEKPFQYGAIYGRREKKEEGEEAGKKITASRLRPIQTPDQFEEHIKEVAEAVYKASTSTRNKNKKKQVECYKLDLCILIVKKKKPALPKKTIAPTVPSMNNISLTSSSESSISSINIEEVTPTISSEPAKKRKKIDLFKFKARSLSIYLHAPIETIHRKTTVTTAVPTGKTIKSIQYDLERFILNFDPIGSDSEDESMSSNVEKEDLDERFATSFTLSKFRKDLMVLALEKFPEEYALKTKSLGPKCKLYIQRQWNSSSWSDINTTDDLIYTLKDQMETRSRVRENVLSVRLAFGRAKVDNNFQSLEEFDTYTDDDYGDGMLFFAK